MTSIQLKLASLLVGIPIDITVRVEQTYNEIHTNFLQGKFEPSELNGGKFVESVYRLLEFWTTTPQKYTDFSTQISNLPEKLRQFENCISASDNIRFHIPRALIFIYNIRNKRGVGHIGGDVSPNQMDATVVMQTSKWVVCEIIRTAYSVTTLLASAMVDQITVKEHQSVWQVGNKKRILNTTLSNEDKALLILYSEWPNPINYATLSAWVEYSNSTVFKNKIIKKIHTDKLVEFDEETNLVHLSPKGVSYVEKNIPISDFQ